MEEYFLRIKERKEYYGYSNTVVETLAGLVQVARVYHHNDGLFTCPWLSKYGFKTLFEVSDWIKERFGFVVEFIEKE